MEEQQATPRLGIDVGGVIMNSHDKNEDTRSAAKKSR